MTLRVGERIGGLEILSPLKAGGMATLFLARREGSAGFSKHVAVKVVHPHLASDRAFVEMFLEEARLCAQIHHPNVVQVEELGEIDGSYYLVMEYVHGASLGQLVVALARRGERLPVPMAIAIAMQIADGLHAAHEAADEHGRPLHVVHRDVSPQNVLVAYRGFVKLIDFGVAKALGRAQTSAGLLKGKLGYMAPEQAFGRAIDRRIDVYALGIVLFEMLTAKKLFSADDDMALLELVRDPRVPPPSTLRPEVGPAVDAAIAAMLAPDPSARIPTAAEARERLADACPEAMRVTTGAIAAVMRDALGEQIDRERRSLPPSFASVQRSSHDAPTHVLDDAPTTATPTPVFEPEPPSKRRSPARSLVAPLVLALAIGGAVYWLAPRDDPAPVRVAPRRAPAIDALVVIDAGAVLDASRPPDAGHDASPATPPPRADHPHAPIERERHRERDAGAERRSAGPTILRELYDGEERPR